MNNKNTHPQEPQVKSAEEMKKEILKKHVLRHACMEDEEFDERFEDGTFQADFDAMEEYAQFKSEPTSKFKEEYDRRRALLEDVVTVLDLSDDVYEKHGPLGTEPAELVRLVLEQKDRQIRMLKSGMKDVSEPTEELKEVDELKTELTGVKFKNMNLESQLAEKTKEIEHLKSELEYWKKCYATMQQSYLIQREENEKLKSEPKAWTPPTDEQINNWDFSSYPHLTKEGINLITHGMKLMAGEYLNSQRKDSNEKQS